MKMARYCMVCDWDEDGALLHGVWLRWRWRVIAWCVIEMKMARYCMMCDWDEDGTLLHDVWLRWRWHVIAWCVIEMKMARYCMVCDWDEDGTLLHGVWLRWRWHVIAWCVIEMKMACYCMVCDWDENGVPMSSGPGSSQCSVDGASLDDVEHSSNGADAVDHSSLTMSSDVGGWLASTMLHLAVLNKQRLNWHVLAVHLYCFQIKQRCSTSVTVQCSLQVLSEGRASFFLSFFLIRGGTRSLRMPAVRPASQAGPMRNLREGTSVLLRDLSL